MTDQGLSLEQLVLLRGTDLRLFEKETHAKRCEIYDAIEKGLSLDCCDENGNTMLHFAVALNLVEDTNLLLSRGAKSDIINNSNDTALDIAIDQGNQIIRQILSRRDEYSSFLTQLGDSGKVSDELSGITRMIRWRVDVVHEDYLDWCNLTDNRRSNHTKELIDLYNQRENVTHQELASLASKKQLCFNSLSQLKETIQEKESICCRSIWEHTETEKYHRRLLETISRDVVTLKSDLEMARTQVSWKGLVQVRYYGGLLVKLWKTMHLTISGSSMILVDVTTEDGGGADEPSATTCRFSAAACDTPRSSSTFSWHGGKSPMSPGPADLSSSSSAKKKTTGPSKQQRAFLLSEIHSITVDSGTVKGKKANNKKSEEVEYWHEVTLRVTRAGQCNSDGMVSMFPDESSTQESSSSPRLNVKVDQIHVRIAADKERTGGHHRASQRDYSTSLSLASGAGLDDLMASNTASNNSIASALTAAVSSHSSWQDEDELLRGSMSSPSCGPEHRDSDSSGGSESGGLYACVPTIRGFLAAIKESSNDKVVCAVINRFSSSRSTSTSSFSASKAAQLSPNGHPTNCASSSLSLQHCDMAAATEDEQGDLDPDSADVDVKKILQSAADKESNRDSMTYYHRASSTNSSTLSFSGMSSPYHPVSIGQHSHHHSTHQKFHHHDHHHGGPVGNIGEEDGILLDDANSSPRNSLLSSSHSQASSSVTRDQSLSIATSRESLTTSSLTGRSSVSSSRHAHTQALAQQRSSDYHSNHLGLREENIISEEEISELRNQLTMSSAGTGSCASASPRNAAKDVTGINGSMLGKLSLKAMRKLLLVLREKRTQSEASLIFAIESREKYLNQLNYLQSLVCLVTDPPALPTRDSISRVNMPSIDKAVQICSAYKMMLEGGGAGASGMIPSQQSVVNMSDAERFVKSLLNQNDCLVSTTDAINTNQQGDTASVSSSSGSHHKCETDASAMTVTMSMTMTEQSVLPNASPSRPRRNLGMLPTPPGAAVSSSASSHPSKLSFAEASRITRSPAPSPSASFCERDTSKTPSSVTATANKQSLSVSITPAERADYRPSPWRRVASSIKKNDDVNNNTTNNNNNHATTRQSQHEGSRSGESSAHNQDSAAAALAGLRLQYDDDDDDDNEHAAANVDTTTAVEDDKGCSDGDKCGSVSVSRKLLTEECDDDDVERHTESKSPQRRHVVLGAPPPIFASLFENVMHQLEQIWTSEIGSFEAVQRLAELIELRRNVYQRLRALHQEEKVISNPRQQDLYEIEL